MATHTGSEGTVKVGANAIAEIRSYSLEETADTAEDTSMGDSYRTFKTTLKAWTGSVDVDGGTWTVKNTYSLLAGQKFIMNIHLRIYLQVLGTRDCTN